MTQPDPDPVDPGPENIRVLVPRVRRAVEGIGTPEQWSDDQMKDAVADAIADVILYTGGVFGKDLLVLERDDVTGAPIEYATSEPLTLPEGSVIAYQAALTAVYTQMQDIKVQETIRDEGAEWSYSLSATLLRDRINQLQNARDLALEALAGNASEVAFIDLWHERDYLYGHQLLLLCQ